MGLKNFLSASISFTNSFSIKVNDKLCNLDVEIVFLEKVLIRFKTEKDLTTDTDVAVRTRIKNKSL